VVIIPAFGTTLEMEARLREKGIPIESYNTTCPFVEKVWNRSEQIAQKGYTVIVHGKPSHEETRATFSHAAAHTPTLVINDMDEAIELSRFIKGEKPWDGFEDSFKGRYSAGFDPKMDLRKIGVVNQTTMLASDTQAIADYLKATMLHTFKPADADVSNVIADTRDTLCYATNDNQSAVHGMLEQPADFAIVIGGYNSSNTSHLVELCERKLPTYHIDHPNRIEQEKIHHYHFEKHAEALTKNYLPLSKNPVEILITSGASCPDALVEQVIEKIAGYFVHATEYQSALNRFMTN
jgi:4-hydroxy-3-methylbut-2-enyl diphosphate reductase